MNSWTICYNLFDHSQNSAFFRATIWLYGTGFLGILRTKLVYIGGVWGGPCKIVLAQLNLITTEKWTFFRGISKYIFFVHFWLNFQAFFNRQLFKNKSRSDEVLMSVLFLIQFSNNSIQKITGFRGELKSKQGCFLAKSRSIR